VLHRATSNCVKEGRGEGRKGVLHRAISKCMKKGRGGGGRGFCTEPFASE
jgi:hypothetical protein